MGMGETEAGSILLVGCAVGAMIAPLSGRILDRWGARPPVLADAVLAFCGVALSAALSAHLETLPATAIYVVFAFGQCLMVGNMLTTSLGFLPAATKADGNAVINTPQQLSGAIGTAVAIAVINAAQVGAQDLAQATIASTRGAYLLLTAVMVIALLDAAYVVLRLYHR